MQALLSSLKGEPLDADELLIKLQAFDAQRLLHSPTVCTQALVDAGISKEEAKDVATALYTPGSPLTQASAPTSPYKTSSAASTPPGSPLGQQNHSRRTLSAGITTPAMRGPSPSRLRPSGGSAGQTLQTHTNPNAPTSSLGPSAKPSLPPPRIALPRGSTAATTVRLHQQQQQQQQPPLVAAVLPPASSAPLRTSSLPVSYTTIGSLPSSRHASPQRSSSGSIKPPQVDPIVVSSGTPSIDVRPLDLKQPDTPPGSPTSAVPRSPSSPSPRDDDTVADNDWDSPRVNGFSRRSAAPWKEAIPASKDDLTPQASSSPSSPGMVPSAVFTAMRPPSALSGGTAVPSSYSNDSSFSPAGSAPGSLAGTPPRTPAPRPRMTTGANTASPLTPLQRSPSDSS